jgi:hypothetical protein
LAVATFRDSGRISLKISINTRFGIIRPGGSFSGFGFAPRVQSGGAMSACTDIRSPSKQKQIRNAMGLFHLILRARRATLG